MEYKEFLENKTQLSGNFGFDNDLFIPDYLFDFQKELLKWSLKKGRSAIFADCGMGKTIIELVWAENVIRKTNKSVLILTPLAVTFQFLKEGERFKIKCEKNNDGVIKENIIYVTNYEKLHLFNPNDFSGVVCDESSILKNFSGIIKNQINIFMRKIKYRLLATATAAPNDYIELGTSSEALGYLGYIDLLNKFFVNDQNNTDTHGSRGRFADVVKWRLKGHSEIPFWRYITSWSRAIRKPSDLGFDDKDFILPNLNIEYIKIDSDGYIPKGQLFSIEANGITLLRKEVKHTIQDKCKIAAEIVNNSKEFFVVWCNLNEEGDLLEKLIPDSIQVSGKDNDDKKEKKLLQFSNGEKRVMIIKPKIGAFGLNWQHCNNIIYFPTYSYEQYYQAIRRCWRFGQEKEVNVKILYTDGLNKVIKILEHKSNQADKMFENLVKEINNSLTLKNNDNFNKKEELPKWL